MSAFLLDLAGPWPALPSMDVVFLRNVLNYFEPATRTIIIDRVHRLLRPGGALFLGSAETSAGLHHGFKREEASGTSYFRR